MRYCESREKKGELRERERQNKCKAVSKSVKT